MERLIFDINKFRASLVRSVVSRNFELIIIKMEFAVKNRDNDELISLRKKRLLVAPGERSLVSSGIRYQNAFDVRHFLSLFL